MPLPQNTFAPKNKTKGLFDKTKALMSKRKPEQSFCYAPTEESGCILSMRFFSGNTSREWRRRKHDGIIHIPGCICRFALGFCKGIKKRTETLYQNFSPFMVSPSKNARNHQITKSELPSHAFSLKKDHFVKNQKDFPTGMSNHICIGSLHRYREHPSVCRFQRTKEEEFA